MLLLTTELLENSIEKRESNILYATEKEKEKRWEKKTDFEKLTPVGHN